MDSNTTFYAASVTSTNNHDAHQTIYVGAKHPRDMAWDELTEAERHRIARGWWLDPRDSGDLNAAARFFNLSSPANRWHYICASESADGSYQDELRRIADNIDPATTAVFVGREE